MENTKVKSNTIIPAKVASERSYQSVKSDIDKCVEELIPIINKAIERACDASNYDTEVDITKYRHLTVLADTLISKLKAAGYSAKLVDHEPQGYYLYIKWS